MRVLVAFGVIAILLASGTAAGAQYVISEDRGGRIGTYVDKYANLRDSDQRVVIDGLCASACTIVLAAIPRDRICVTSRANLGFHAAWDHSDDGPRTNRAATAMLMDMYPTNIRQWIRGHGGLKSSMIYLKGRALNRHYAACSPGNGRVLEANAAPR